MSNFVRIFLFFYLSMIFILQIFRIFPHNLEYNLEICFIWQFIFIYKYRVIDENI
jgi:hypothetical protein